MTILEGITNETCVHKIKALKNLYADSKTDECRHCRDYTKDCYLPISKTELPIRTGRFAMATTDIDDWNFKSFGMRFK